MISEDDTYEVWTSHTHMT